MGEVLKALEADKSVKKGEAIALANRVTGVDANYRGRSEALDAVGSWVRRKIASERRLDGTSGIF